MIAVRLAPDVESKSRPESTEVEAPRQAEDESLYLIGRPTLKQFLRFVKSNAIEPPPERVLADQWQAASGIVGRLAVDQAGSADDPPIGRLGPEYEPLLINFLKDPLVRYGFNTVPTDVGLVELDRMVVWQKHIDLTHSRRLEARLGPAPDQERIFRTCLPFDHPQPPVQWSRMNHSSFVFMSPSNDLRYLGTMRIEPRHIKDYPPPGDLVGV